MRSYSFQSPLALIALVVLAQVPPARTGQEAVQSPTLRAFQDAAASAPSVAADEFWRRIAVSGTPLVEPSPRSADHSLVTFLYRSQPDSQVRLRSSLTALFGNGVSSPAHELGNLARLPGTDAYFVTAEVPNELRASYRFEVTGRDQPIVDPLNPRVFLPKTEFAESQFALSKSPAQPWTDVRVAGTWQEHRVPSVTLGAPQPVWIYTPAGYDPSAAPYPAFIGLDSVTYGRILPTARVTEYLVARQQVRPTLIVAAPDLAEVGDRGSYDPAVTFLADELLPWVRARYRVSARPSDIVISGASRRGMLAAYAAFRRPDAFQRVLSLSGSFYWRPPGHPEFEWLPALVAREPARPLRIYLAAGSLETVVTPTNVGHYLLATNRHMRSVLQAKGYEMRYVEFCGSHSPINWQDQLLPGLAYLMPPP